MKDIFDDDKIESMKLENARETLEELLTLAKDVKRSTDIFTYDLTFAKILAAIRVYFVSKGKKDDDSKNPIKSEPSEMDSSEISEYQENTSSIQSPSNATSTSFDFDDSSGSMEILNNRSPLSHILKNYADVCKSNSKPIKRRSVRNRTVLRPDVPTQEYRPYTKDEDKIIFQWIQENQQHDRQSRKTWRHMAATCGLDRTPGSLYTRYKNSLRTQDMESRKIRGFTAEETAALFQWLRDHPDLDGRKLSTWTTMMENPPRELRHSNPRTIMRHFGRIIRYSAKF